MHSLRHLISTRSIFSHLTPSLRRHIHSKPPHFHRKSIILTVTGFGLASYYYLYRVPEPLNEDMKTEYTNFVDDKKSPDSDPDGIEKDSKTKFNFIDKVVKKCAPGVFHIYITNTKPSNNQEIGGSPFVYGSGFVISEDGWALTNAHVVLNKDSFISCKMSDGTICSAEIIDIDVNIDVALLKLNTDKKLTFLPLEEPGVVDVGEWVVALGSPLCLSNSISVGVVSSVNRTAKELGMKNYSMSYIQTDALITFGNSGGPLVNINGKVIGISSLRLTSGISFAIPIEFCLQFLNNCKKFNTPASSQASKGDDEITLFGLATIPITSDLLIDLMQKKLWSFPKDVDEGLLVWKVLEGSLAHKCGLSTGDIITHIDKVPVKYAADLYKRKPERDKIEFVVIKKATQEEITLTIELNNLN